MISEIASIRKEYMRSNFALPKIIYMTLHDYKKLKAENVVPEECSNIFGMRIRLDLRLTNGNFRII